MILPLQKQGWIVYDVTNDQNKILQASLDLSFMAADHVSHEFSWLIFSARVQIIWKYNFKKTYKKNYNEKSRHAT